MVGWSVAAAPGARARDESAAALPADDLPWPLLAPPIAPHWHRFVPPLHCGACWNFFAPFVGAHSLMREGVFHVMVFC